MIMITKVDKATEAPYLRQMRKCVELSETDPRAAYHRANEILALLLSEHGYNATLTAYMVVKVRNESA